MAKSMSILHQNSRKFFLEEVITLVYKKEKEKLNEEAFERKFKGVSLRFWDQALK